MTRRIFLARSAAWAGAGFLPCVGVRAGAAMVGQSHLHLGLASEPSSADPHWAALQANFNLAQHLYDALVQVDAGGRYVPGIATGWRAVDSLTWEFRLRTGVHFHDGSQLTAEDVLFSLRRPSRVSTSPAPLTTFSRQIASMQAIDATTVQFKTREPYGGLPGDLSSIFIVSKAAAEKATTADFDSGKAAIGTGPFRLRSFTKGGPIELERHTRYWGGAVAWARVTMSVIADEAKRTAALLASQVDVIEGVRATDVAVLRAGHRFSIVQRTSWRTIFLSIEQFTDRSPWITDAAGNLLSRSPLKDRRVRRAMSLMLDRTALARNLLDGLAEPAGQLISPGMIGYNPDLRPEEADPVLARQLLIDAGYADGFNLVMHAPNDRYVLDRQVAEAIASLWTTIGIRTHVESIPSAQYFPRARRGEFSVAMLGYGSLAGDFALRALLGTPDSGKGWGTWNWGKYSNPRLDAAIQESLRTVEAARRQQRAAAAMALAITDVAAIALHHQFSTWALRGGLRYVGRVDEFTLAHRVRPV